MQILIFKDSVDQPSVQLYVGDCVSPGPKVELTQDQRDEIELALRQALQDGER